MAWRLTRRQWEAGKGMPNRKALRVLVESGKKPGVIGYVGREPVAWCAVAPRGEFGALDRSRVLKSVDDEPVWSVSCFFVAKPFRKMGLSVALLRTVTELVARRGGRIVEGYPTRPTMRQSPDLFLWTGVPSAFRAAGFVEVARRSPNRPIMRYYCR